MVMIFHAIIWLLMCFQDLLVRNAGIWLITDYEILRVCDSLMLEKPFVACLLVL